MSNGIDNTRAVQFTMLLHAHTFRQSRNSLIKMSANLLNVHYFNRKKPIQEHSLDFKKNLVHSIRFVESELAVVIIYKSSKHTI